MVNEDLHHSRNDFNGAIGSQLAERMKVVNGRRPERKIVRNVCTAVHAFTITAAP